MLETSIKYNPSELFELAKHCFASEKFDDALHLLTILSDSGYVISGMHYLAALCCDRLDKPEKVIDLFQSELQISPTDDNLRKLVTQVTNDWLNNPTLSDNFDTCGKLLICGLPPGHGGTGIFFRDLIPISTRNGYHNVHPSVNRFSKAEQWKLSTLKNRDIILMHPQTIGLGVVQSLVKQNNVSIYVLDNSFFCLQSYNHRDTKRGECLDCLGRLDKVAHSCMPFPVPYSKQDYLSFLAWLMNTYQSISFICQTYTQAGLLARHFGTDVKCRVVGLKTEEFNDLPNTNSKFSNLTSQINRFDIIYHGSIVRAKGILFFIQLAAELPEFNFLLPMTAQQALIYYGNISQRSNLFYEDVNWDNGLKEYIQSCRLVLCPSEWSAPIEMALIKSLEFNGSVGVLSTKHGFESEIPNNILMRLSLDIIESANIVRN